jgi:ketosteroid isomerase-like protein
MVRVYAPPRFAEEWAQPKEGSVMERQDVEGWLKKYVDAWKSYDRDEITALFSDDIVYRYHPYDEPIRGLQAVVGSWLGEGDNADQASTRDEPGTYEASYRAIAVEGDTAVATGTSTYLTEPGGAVKTAYDNCFVMRFDESGRCREFTEWFMERPAPSP